MLQKQSFKVAGHIFSLLAEQGDPLWSALDNYSPFRCDGDDGRIFTLFFDGEVDDTGKTPLYVSEPEGGEQRIDIYTTTGGYLFEMAPFGDVPVCGFLSVNGDFTVGHLKAEKGRRFCVNNALMLMYAFRTAGMDTIEMHASVTVNDGKGFLFLGKSGTGKSTHSSLWLKNIPGSRLLNDDNPIVRLTPGGVRVYGSPWSGKTPCYKDEDYPVGAFVRINQAPRNVIRRIGLAESFASISSSTSGLRAIRSIADGLFGTISTIVQTIPCYILDCLPDDEAARVCSREVLGHE